MMKAFGNSTRVRSAVGSSVLVQFFHQLSGAAQSSLSLSERLLPKEFPAYSIPYVRPTTTFETLVQEISVHEDLRASSIEYARTKAAGLRKMASPKFLAELQSLAPEVLENLEVASVASALIQLAHGVERAAARKASIAHSLLTKANQLIAGVDLKQYASGINGSYASVGEGWVRGNLIGIPNGRIDISVRGPGPDGSYYLDVRFYFERGGKSTKARVHLGKATPASFREAFLKAYADFTAAGKSAKSLLNQLAARDRRLTADEVEFFASYFAVANQGFIDSPKLVGSLFTANDNGSPAFKADLQDLRNAADVIQNYGHYQMEGEGDLEESLTSSRNLFRGFTLVKIAKTWPDLLEICLYLATQRG